MSRSDILQSLGSIRRRVRLLSVAHGVGWVIAASAGLVLLAVLADYLLVLPAVPRLILLLAVLGGAGTVIWRWVARPVVTPLSLRDVAGRVEHVFPDFEDRLRSTVDFLTADAPGSSGMKQRVIAETARLVEGVDLGGVIVYRPTLSALGAGMGAVLLLALLAIWSGPLYTSVALSRLFTPFTEAVWPKRVNIQLVGEVPQRVPVGQRIDVRMRLSKGDSGSMRAVVFYRYGDGPVQQEVMTRGPDGAYSVSLDARLTGEGEGRLNVWMKAGDDTRYLPAIVVVPRLTITSMQVMVTPPDYARQPPVTMNLAQGQVVVTRGSKVTVLAEFNKPLSRTIPMRLEPVAKQMKEGKETAPAQLAGMAWSVQGTAASGSLVAEESVRFHLVGTDTDGFASSGLEEYELVVRPDQDPSVQIEQPRRNESRTPEGYLPLQGLAEDDFGVQSLELVVERLGDKRTWTIPLVREAAPVEGVTWARVEDTSQWQRYRMNWQWELGALQGAELKNGDVLEYHLLVRDNYSFKGQAHAAVASGKLRVTIISQEELANRMADELRQVARRVQDIRNAQVNVREETQALGKDTREKAELEAADRAVADRLGDRQSALAAQTKQAAGRAEEILHQLQENRSKAEEQKQLAVDVGARLDRAAEHPMKEAAGNLGALREQGVQRDPRQRDEQLSKATNQQTAAVEALDGALDRLGSIGSLQQMIDQVRSLLEQQRKLSSELQELGRQNLGKSPEQMSEEDRRKLEELARRQEELARQTDKAIEALSKLSGQMEKSDPSDASAMKQSAETGQQQQVSANQSRAAQEARQNQQSQAQSAQQQAELGLTMMLTQLCDAEQRKLEALSRKLEELRTQVQRLVQRQAGHNLDNLALQGARAVHAVDPKVLAELVALANRRADQQAPVPALALQTAGQEQTERNARDISKTAGEVPNGAEPSAHLARAAGKMERAIVALRGRDPGGAYDPSQVEALSALREALRIIDQQKEEADRKRRQQQRESIREVYEKVKQQQQKLNETTLGIERARGADGALTREELVRLGQLPVQQKALSERLETLEKDLEALGSVVFIWSNKDIVQTMTQVTGALGKRQTGAVTQAEQARIVDQLEAMIQSLQIEPPAPQEFAEGRGGGGGGGGAGAQARRLPAEAELRLIKALQSAINRSTRTVDAQPEKDAAVLQALAERQSELRGVLDQLLQKASGGKVKLGAEPENRDVLPEEASDKEDELAELERDLLNDSPSTEKIEKDVNRVGDRMARSRQRLGLNQDPGKTTQRVQERILHDLDELIAMSSKQQQQQSSAQSQAQAQRMPAPGESPQQGEGQASQSAQGNRADTPATSSENGPGQSAEADASSEIREHMSEWGGVTPRQRQAVIEGAGETVISKYKKLVDDYYRALATKATERN